MRWGIKQLPDLRDVWGPRLARVRRSQARANTSGMTRPTRDPEERAFLESRGGLGPFREARPARQLAS